MRTAMTLAKQALAASAALLLAGAAFAQKTTLTVYTAWETETLKPYAEGFAKVAPDIELKYVRDSTGVITAKALAEKANPQADVIAGLAAPSLELLKQEGMLQPYVPKGFERLTRDYSDKATPPRGSAWTSGARRCASTPSKRRSATCPSPRRGAI